MTRLIASLAVAVGAGILAGCSTSFLVAQIVGSGNIVTQERQVESLDAVTSVDLRGSSNVTITIDPNAEPSLTIVADDNLLELLTTEVKGDKLIIDFEESVSPSKATEITLTLPSLSGVSLSGSGTIRVSAVTGEVFNAAIAGSGDIIADGTVERVDVRLSGSGDVRLEKLTAKTATVSIAGSGDVVVHATESVRASVSGSGDVVVHGKPGDVKRSIAGSGRVTVK